MSGIFGTSTITGADALNRRSSNTHRSPSAGRTDHKAFSPYTTSGSHENNPTAAALQVRSTVLKPIPNALTSVTTSASANDTAAASAAASSSATTPLIVTGGGRGGDRDSRSLSRDPSPPARPSRSTNSRPRDMDDVFHDHDDNGFGYRKGHPYKPNACCSRLRFCSGGGCCSCCTCTNTYLGIICICVLLITAVFVAIAGLMISVAVDLNQIMSKARTWSDQDVPQILVVTQDILGKVNSISQGDVDYLKIKALNITGTIGSLNITQTFAFVQDVLHSVDDLIQGTIENGNINIVVPIGRQRSHRSELP